MNTEERIIRLEENLAFQERLSEGLHAALLEQQKQISQLELLAQKQDLRLRELAALLEEAGRGRPVNERPPHY